MFINTYLLVNYKPISCNKGNKNVIKETNRLTDLEDIAQNLFFVESVLASVVASVVASEVASQIA